MSHWTYHCSDSEGLVELTGGCSVFGLAGNHCPGWERPPEFNSWRVWPEALQRWLPLLLLWETGGSAGEVCTSPHSPSPLWSPATQDVCVWEIAFLMWLLCKTGVKGYELICCLTHFTLRAPLRLVVGILGHASVQVGVEGYTAKWRGC